MKLSEQEINTVTNALRVAAERFAEHVAELKNGGNESLNRLAEQFERQRVESLELSRKIEDAEEVTLA